MKKTLYNKLAISMIGCLFMVLGGLVSQGWALPYYPSGSEIASWTLTHATDNSGVSGGVVPAYDTTAGDVETYTSDDWLNSFGYIEFDVKFEKGSSGYNGGAAIGSTNSQDLSSYDSFAISISNVNEHYWYYALYVTDLNNTFIGVGSTPLTYNPNDGSVDGAVFLANESTATLSLDLTTAANFGVDLTNAYIGFAIGNKLPAPNYSGSDLQSETRVAPVPEPATILLFGTGLIGIAGFARRKVKKA